MKLRISSEYFNSNFHKKFGYHWISTILRAFIKQGRGGVGGGEGGGIIEKKTPIKHRGCKVALTRYLSNLLAVITQTLYQKSVKERGVCTALVTITGGNNRLRYARGINLLALRFM